MGQQYACLRSRKDCIQTLCSFASNNPYISLTNPYIHIASNGRMIGALWITKNAGLICRVVIEEPSSVCVVGFRPTSDCRAADPANTRKRVHPEYKSTVLPLTSLLGPRQHKCILHYVISVYLLRNTHTPSWNFPFDQPCFYSTA